MFLVMGYLCRAAECLRAKCFVRVGLSVLGGRAYFGCELCGRYYLNSLFKSFGTYRAADIYFEMDCV